MTEEETALYGLLWTMAEYKKHNKDVNDSLVSRSTTTSTIMATSGIGLWPTTIGGCEALCHASFTETIKDLKMAEGLSGLDDWQLKSKIDEQLAFTNCYSQNAALAVEVFAEVLEGCQDAERLDQWLVRRIRRWQEL